MAKIFVAQSNGTLSLSVCDVEIIESDRLLKRSEEGGRAPHMIAATLIDGDIGGNLRVVLKFQTGRSRLDLLVLLWNNQHRALVEEKYEEIVSICLHRYHKAKSGTKEQIRVKKNRPEDADMSADDLNPVQ